MRPAGAGDTSRQKPWRFGDPERRRHRLKGEIEKEMGGSGAGGGPPGDLFIEITVRSHRVFKRKGSDIYPLDLPVTFGEAVLGAKIEVPTIDGIAAMTLPAGTQGGQG